MGIHERLDNPFNAPVGLKRVYRKSYKTGHLRTAFYIKERISGLRAARVRASSTMSKESANRLVQQLQSVFDYMNQSPQEISFYYDEERVKLLFARGDRRRKVLAHNPLASMPMRGKYARRNSVRLMA